MSHCLLQEINYTIYAYNNDFLCFQNHNATTIEVTSQLYFDDYLKPYTILCTKTY